MQFSTGEMWVWMRNSLESLNFELNNFELIKLIGRHLQLKIKSWEHTPWFQSPITASRAGGSLSCLPHNMENSDSPKLGLEIYPSETPKLYVFRFIWEFVQVVWFPAFPEMNFEQMILFSSRGAEWKRGLKPEVWNPNFLDPEPRANKLCNRLSCALWMQGFLRTLLLFTTINNVESLRKQVNDFGENMSLRKKKKRNNNSTKVPQFIWM